MGGPIAPPNLVGGDTLIGENEVTHLDDETKALLKGDPLGGVHAFYSGSFREWWAPLRPGPESRRRNALVGVHDKRSEFAERAVHEWTAEVFAAHDPDEVLCAQYRLMIRTDRTKAEERGKYDATVIEPYTDEQLAAIDAAYASETARGAAPSRAGGRTSRRATRSARSSRAPARHRHGVLARRHGHGALRRQGAAARHTSSASGCRSSSGPTTSTSPTSSSACTGTPNGRQAGQPAIYDYGRMRETWLVHLCTDWMGDDAWLWKLDCEFRRFNYVGDTHWMRGRVVRKFLADGDRPAVELECWGENQRGETTTPGHATILLPSREHGPVRLPDPRAARRTSEQALDALVARFASMEGSEAATRSRPTVSSSRPTAVCSGCASIGRSPQRAHRRHGARAHRDDRSRGQRRSRPRDRVVGHRRRLLLGFRPLAQRTRDSKPRTGATQRQMRWHVNRLIPTMLETQTPIVTAATGHIGLGLNLVLASDFAVVADDARLRAPFTSMGFTPDSGASWLIPRLVGVARAKEMLLLGREITGGTPED